ncbi:hypothetical protein MMARJ_51270 [Mycobacterium marseillense]|uniref:Mechanosensitive ion channel MscS domain-containing protein n=1 Tax=Mycobacterium marseillense TaxID=701042 RepID=A0ABN6A2V8_9MYCO|nr:hypothetical protein MMARJ_51270 [Mycobacterium marseillense]
MNIFASSWFYWAVGIAIGLPVGMILLTELHDALRRRQSPLARQVALLRNYLLPLAALLLLLVQASGIPAGDIPVRILTTVFGLLVVVLLLSGLNATVFESAPKELAQRLPIFIDVARIALICVGLAVMSSYIWGVRIGGVFTALGVTSVVIGLMLQNSVGQIVSGLFMLFEQPFRIDDWLDTGTARGRVVEVNWRAVHRHRQRNPDHAERRARHHVIHQPQPPARTAQGGDHDDLRHRRRARPGVRGVVAGGPGAAAAPTRQRAALSARGRRPVPHDDRVGLTRRGRRRDGHVPALGVVRGPAGEFAPR